MFILHCFPAVVRVHFVFVLSNKSSLPLQLSPQAAVKTSLFSLNTNESVTHQSVLTQHGLCTVLLLC